MLTKTGRDERKRACASVVWLLDNALLNVGSEYSLAYRAHGATTIEVRHVTWLDPARVRFRFRGMHGITWDRVVRLPTEFSIALHGFTLGKRPRDRIFPVQGRHVNEYLRATPGMEDAVIHAQMFRTLHANTWLVRYLDELDRAREKHGLRAEDMKLLFRGVRVPSDDAGGGPLADIARRIASKILARWPPVFVVPPCYRGRPSWGPPGQRWVGALPFLAALLNITPRGVRLRNVDPSKALPYCARWGWDERIDGEEWGYTRDGRYSRAAVSR